MKKMNRFTRRKFLLALTALGGSSALGVLPRRLLAEQEPPSSNAAHPVNDPHSLLQMGQEVVLILIYPGFTAMDAIGPQHMLSSMAGATVKFVAKSAAPVPSETGFDVVPNLTFAQCPPNPTLLIVPGGTTGTLNAIEDSETRDFLRRVGGGAAMVGSVCTGSLLLGAAGLLDGYEATSHWQTLELLPLVGAKPRSERVVFDRNRVTSAGVTAGLDFGLALVRHYRGDFYAKGVQLLAQYDPHPPFPGGGDPKTADPAMVSLLNEMHKPFVELAGKTIQSVHPSPESPAT